MFTVLSADLRKSVLQIMCEIVHVAAWCASVEGVVDTSLFTNRTDLMTLSAAFCATSSGWSTRCSLSVVVVHG